MARKSILVTVFSGSFRLGKLYFKVLYGERSVSPCIILWYRYQASVLIWVYDLVGDVMVRVNECQDSIELKSNHFFDCKKYLRPGSNVITFENKSNTSASFICKIDISVPLSLSTLMTKIPLDVDTSINLDIISFKQDTSARVCPITLQNIEYPGKGENCLHDECFDLKSYLDLCNASGNWSCPICRYWTFLSFINLGIALFSRRKIWSGSCKI